MRLAGWLAMLILFAGPASARDEPANPDTRNETTLEIVRDATPAASPEHTFPRRLMVRASAAGELPLAGPMADLGNAGGGFRLAFGWTFVRRAAVLVELGASRIPRAAGDDEGYALASATILARATMELDEALTVFSEAGGGVALSTARAHAKVNLAGARPMAALAAAAGLEVDLLGWISGEGGARLEVLFAEGTWGATADVATPYVATTLHF